MRPAPIPLSGGHDEPDEGDVPDGPIPPHLEAALRRLRSSGRHAVRILDAGCGGGERLLHLLLRARDLGFLAIEAVGIDRAPHRIALAEARRPLADDPRIGLRFVAGDIATALAEEEEASFDLLLCLEGALDGLPPGQQLRAEAALARVRDGLLFASADEAPMESAEGQDGRRPRHLPGPARGRGRRPRRRPGRVRS